jgi:class 3 adenylate cyclase
VALRAAPELHRVSLRFVDKAAERRFQDQYLRDNLPYIRAAHVVGIAAWAFFGLYRSAGAITDVHVVLHFGVAIPIVAANLALTYVRWYARVWQPAIVALVVANSALVEMHRLLSGHGTRWDDVASLMLVLALTYTLLRLQYLYAASAAALVIGCYTATTVLFAHDPGIDIVAADIYLVAFAVIGTAGAYALELFARVLFLRERQLDRERERGDRLLRNILPEAIIGRLKTRDPRTGTRPIAQRCPDVTVLFADLVGFTGQAASTDPEELVTALDEVFSRFDQLAGRFGLEKIKTIGDAYMAACGRPGPPAGSRGSGGGHGTGGPRMRLGASLAGRCAGRRADRHRLRPGHGGRDRAAQVRLRRLGRHREHRQPARVQRRARQHPGIRGSLRAALG